MADKLSHLNKENNPAMVNVGEKTVTRRTAVAQSVVALPGNIMQLFTNGELISTKGPVFQTAIVAGIMAAKKTGELIPLCHPLGLDGCDISIEVNAANEVVVTCRAEITAKTGVEMEALTGASIAALTVYDMCKALSHDIIIKQTMLIEKTGGKHDFKRT